uniref:Potassium channel domain-containing protein n=1 Tax=Acrobeloides nanus TaxID=290746 RepID=A0A914CTF4_9BILA
MVVRHKDPRNEKALKVPTVNSGYLLALHTLIVVIINNEWIQQIGVLNSIYFSITSIATIGLGDYLPNPRNTFESIVCQFYIAAGITILSAWFTSWSYHYQRLFFIVLRRYLHHIYKEFYLLRHHRKRFSSITFAPSRSSSMDHVEMAEIGKENGHQNGKHEDHNGETSEHHQNSHSKNSHHENGKNGHNPKI